MAKFSPPHQIRLLIDEGVAFPVDRSIGNALTRHFHRLITARSPEANDEFVRVFHGIADSSTARIPRAQDLDCRKGCSLCCRSRVTLLAPEAFALARTIRSKVRHADLHARLRGLAQVHTETDVTERRRRGIACSFLIADACSSYAMRPITCRVFASFDVRACQVTAAGGEDTVPQPAESAMIRSLLTLSAFAAIKAAGLPLITYELNQVLVDLVDEPGLEPRWYAGDDALGSATVSRDVLAPAFVAAVDRAILDAKL